jgi:diguanylate cyclase (GGDEF)-like protein/PAS domain S-box-containing protein
MPVLKPEPPQAEVFRFDQSGALLRKVMENAAVGMVLIGMDGRLLYANKAFGDMLGYEASECVGLSFDTLVHSYDESAAKQQVERLTRGEIDVYNAEHQYRHKDGSALWVSAAVSVLDSDRTGMPLYLIVQIINIDRQKRAEAALAYSESRWNYALEAAGQGVWDHDIRTDGMFYSRTWRTMRGYAPDEHIDSAQEAWLSRVHPEDVPKILAVVEKQDSGIDGFDTMQYRERHKDGHYIWIQSRGRPVEWDENGVPVRTLGTDTDITKLKVAEAQLAEEKERLRVTLESIGDGVIATDGNGLISFMNPIAEDMTGWAEIDAIGMPLQDVFALSGAEATANPVSRSLVEGTPAYLEEDVQLLGKDGRRRDIRASAAPVRTPEGKVIGAVLVFQDITQSRALQRQLAHSASHDDLTGLPNRAAFERGLLAAVDTAQLRRGGHALCYVDLDRFKPVNDGAGHAAGDALLKQVAETIRACCRSHDLAARIGGDEFALLLTDCPIVNARAIAQKIVDSIAALEFSWSGKTYRIGASVGVTSITRAKPSSLGFMGEADAACYAAKAGGRGRVVLYRDVDQAATAK